MKSAKILWPYWLFPMLHFAAVAFAAFAVHYSNGVNVQGFTGDYGLWMDLGNLGIRVFQFTRWIVPVVLLLFFLRAKEKKIEGACFVAATCGVLIATWPLYSGLIAFWERHWTGE